VTAVIEVADLTVKLVALVAPKLTAVAPVNSVPLTLTVVPPVTGPLLGVTLVTVGGAADADAAVAIATAPITATRLTAGPRRCETPVRNFAEKLFVCQLISRPPSGARGVVCSTTGEGATNVVGTNVVPDKRTLRTR
jgi:hypothetical protein